MAQIREIKKRIKSVTNTQKVTHAMELVAAAKMRKSQQAALSGRPYSVNLHEILAKIQGQSEVAHSLLSGNDSPKEFVILVTSDRGLAGGLNINLFREISRLSSSNNNESKSGIEEIKNTIFITIGKKARQFATKTNQEIYASFGSEETSALELARQLSKIAIEGFTNGEVSRVRILYPHFASTVNQTPTWIQLLPIKRQISESPTQDNDLLFEPTVDEILNVILPHHVLTAIYQILLEAKASEHSARMVAMKNATDAADDLIEDLTLTYNQARQEAITKELLDIVTAQRAFQ